MPTMTAALKGADTAPLRACDERLIDPDLMFPMVESTVPGRATVEEEKARAVCARCPIRARCLEEVLEVEMPYGVAGGLTAAERRALRARRRGLDLDATPMPAGSDTWEGPGAGPGAGAGSVAAGSAEDTTLDAVLAAHSEFGHGADPARVRELVAGRGPAVASRWEVALATVTLLRLGRSVSATARSLGEQYTQVKRWHDRDQRGGALILGHKGAGTSAVARPLAPLAAAATVGAAESPGAASRGEAA